MTAPRGAALYSRELLALAVELAAYPYQTSAPVLGSARSRTCGSTIALSSLTGEAIEGLGLKVSACAVGQAAAAIFARSASGLTLPECEEYLEELRNWLCDGDELPRWPGITALAAAREYPGRHEAILLPWRAAIDALCNAQGGG